MNFNHQPKTSGQKNSGKHSTSRNTWMTSALAAIAVTASGNTPADRFSETSRRHSSGYDNIAASPEPASWLQRLRLGWDFFFNKPMDTQPDQEIPVEAISQETLQAAPEGSLWRIGHSTVLIKLNGRFWLTDPVFSERASPFSWLGPRRFHAPPISIDNLPELEAVILSHDHYDHLDEAAIRKLAAKTAHFVTPTGVGDLLVEWGIPAERIHQLNWWEAIEIAGLNLVATPAQHFSGRGVFDSNRRLWCSWVLKSAQFNIFFSGDTGYFEGFKEIGKRYGPFDLTMIEAGAYDLRWSSVHMLPEQTLQAHLDLQGRWLLPIHNSTFDLAFHRWNEPLERVHAQAEQHNVRLMTPVIGASVHLSEPHAFSAWWRKPEVRLANARPDSLLPLQAQ